MIEKILNALRNREEELRYSFKGVCDAEDLKIVHKVQEVMHCMEIVQEVAQEYGDGWIPTKEMLFPRYGQKVLASIKCEDAKDEVIISKYERQEYWHNGIITAWQPLPEPYQKGGQSNGKDL